MAGKWSARSLRESNVTLIDCDHRTPPASGIGYPYVAIPQLRNGRIDLADVRRITHEHFVEWTRKAKPSAHDVVLSRRCNPGETAFVPSDLEFALGQNLVLLRADGTRVDPLFLRWLVRGPEWWEQIGTFINVGAVFDSLKCADIPEFRLHIPPLDEQRAIAHILGTLDDKVELNRRMNETLEAIGRALFKSWFVDFDPVRAKADGREPALPKLVVDRFPDSFEESELDEIPKRWTKAGIGEWTTALSGGTPAKDNPDLWGGNVPWISPKVMTGVHADEAESYVTQDALDRGMRLAPSGATLVMVRGMGLHQEVRVSQARRDVVFNQDVKALVPTRIEPTLLLFALLDARRSLLGKVETSGHGTGRLASDVLLAYRITMPPADVQKELAAVFDTINERIASLRDQSRTLERLLDTLLPRLVSGELRVKDAERFIANVA